MKHLFLYDEIAALALIDEKATIESKRNYILKISGKGRLHLSESKNGNINVLTIRRPGEIKEELESLWTSVSIRPHHHEEPQIPSEILLKVFHGHLGRMSSSVLELRGWHYRYFIMMAILGFPQTSTPHLNLRDHVLSMVSSSEVVAHSENAISGYMKPAILLMSNFQHSKEIPSRYT